MNACTKAILFVALLESSAVNMAMADRLSYERDVRPILKANCFQCHGEDGAKEGELDLRLRRFIIAGGESGAAVVSGDADGSLLYRRVAAGEMPPEDKHLAADEVAVIRQWIEQGAHTLRDEPESLEEGPYFTQEERDFWAFQPIKKLRTPTVLSELPIVSPIDAFVLRRLQQEGLDFSALASNRVLVRRVYFDLAGLPPTPEEVESFLDDGAADSYERLIDRLLASPRYGERWGRHWLDVAGYADSEGYVDADPPREWAYRYRDYVIRAFNEDMPFDQFVTEQLAGDELVPRPHTNFSDEQIRKLTATGFLRMAPDGTAAGGIDQNVARNEVIAGTINIMTTSLLGLTVGCARCHNHRYDPISQRDYYQLRAIFEPALDWKSWRAPNARRVSLYTDEDRKMAAGIEAKAKQAEEYRKKILDGHLKRTLYEELIKAPDDLKETLRTAFETAVAERSKEQVALLKEHPNIGNITSGSLYLYSEQRGRRADEIAAVADKTEAALIEKVRAAQPGVTVTAQTLKEFDADGASLVVEYREAAETCRKTDSKKQLADLQKGISEIRATKPKEIFIRALTEPDNHTPETFLFKRGNHSQHGKAAAPGGLDILANPASTLSSSIPSNDPSLTTTGRRLAYARQLTSGNHPLLARVIVNRIWFHHFGRGIVNTPGDFGQLGQRPSPPELLDWLARDFIENGWSIKRLHRMILTSHTYRQTSARTEQFDTVDPDNRLYARQSIRRIESEIFRDAVLAVSGQINDKMFGPPLPVMEDGVGQIVVGKEKLDGERKPSGDSGLGGEEHRRSLYIQVRRTRPLAVLETFDIATVAPNCTKRPSSNVAPQALLLMNSDFMARYAASFADRVIREAGQSLTEQVRLAWSIAYAEEAPAEAVVAMTEFIEQQAKAYQNDNDKLAADAARKKALSVVCQGIMAANQFIYVD